jgi:DNA invertase Pin-like site-specific DNA recombinase
MSTCPLEDDRRRAERVVELTQRGLSATDIATIERISRRSVYRIRQKHGASRHHAVHRLTEEELSRAAELLADGASRAEVARTIGCSDTAVARRFPGQCWSYVQVGQFAALRLRFGAMA